MFKAIIIVAASLTGAQAAGTGLRHHQKIDTMGPVAPAIEAPAFSKATEAEVVAPVKEAKKAEDFAAVKEAKVVAADKEEKEAEVVAAYKEAKEADVVADVEEAKEAEVAAFLEWNLKKPRSLLKKLKAAQLIKLKEDHKEDMAATVAAVKAKVVAAKLATSNPMVVKAIMKAGAAHLLKSKKDHKKAMWTIYAGYKKAARAKVVAAKRAKAMMPRFRRMPKVLPVKEAKEAEDVAPVEDPVEEAKELLADVEPIKFNSAFEAFKAKRPVARMKAKFVAAIKEAKEAEDVSLLEFDWQKFLIEKKAEAVLRRARAAAAAARMRAEHRALLDKAKKAMEARAARAVAAAKLKRLPRWGKKPSLPSWKKAFRL